jgi:hypothetical protein
MSKETMTVAIRHDVYDENIRDSVSNEAIREHVYPPEIKPGGPLCFTDADLMRKAIERAADLIICRGERPSFTRLANVICPTNESDVEFVQTCTFDFDKEQMFLFDMAVFAYSCLYIRDLGWAGFLEKLRERHADKEQLFSVI